MRRTRLFASAAAALPLAFGACAEEGPIGIGGPLLDERVRTVEVVLEAVDYLTDATTFTGYVRPAEAPWMLLAREYDGVLDANALFNIAPTPATVNYRDTTGVVRTDTLPGYVSGELVFNVDTLRSAGLDQDVLLRLYEVGEDWDPATATWTMRVDSPGVQHAWTVAGGTPGPLVDSATLAVGLDTVVFTVDSAVINRWRDTANARRGLLLVAETPGVRIRSTRAGVRAPVTLRLSAIPSERPDTVVTTAVGVAASSFVYTPEPGPEAALRIGGMPSARVYLRFREDFRDLRVGDCAVGAGGPCVQLRDATINSAHLLVEPIAVAPAFLPEDSLRMRARAVETGPLAPRERAPLGDTLNIPAAIPPSAFATPSSAVIALPITRFVATLADPPVEGLPAATRDIVLLALPESALFGFGRFAGAPRLRLVVSFQEGP